MYAWHPLDDDPPGLDALPRVLGRTDALRRLSTSVLQRRTASGRWLGMLPGVYLTAPPANRLDWLYAATLHGGPASVISGYAALQQYGVKYLRPTPQILLLVPPECGARSIGPVVVRKSSRLPAAALWPGPRLAPAARALGDYVRSIDDLGAVRAAVASVVQRNLASIDELSRDLKTGRRNGSGHFRTALAEVSAGARSAAEAKAATALRRSGIDDFVQNVRVAGATRVWTVDFYWPKLRAVLEIDSVEWHFDQPSWERTMDRAADLIAAGCSVLPQRPGNLKDAGTFVATVRGWLDGLRGG